MRPTTKPGAGALELERDRWWNHLRDLDAEWRAHLVVSEMKEPRPRARRRQIEHRDDFTRIEPAEESGRSAESHVHVRRRITGDFKLLGDVPELERHSQAALDDMLAGHRQPEQRRQRDGQHLQPKMAERMIAHQTS
jgi:hypothetical protein